MADATADLDDTNWTLDLESALIEGCDFGTLRNICKGHPFPPHLRSEVWQICLNVTDKGNQLSAFDELYDMPEQAILREDCNLLVDKLGNEEEEKLSVASDLESIITFFCKCRGARYQRNNGWLEILQPMLALKMGRAELYNCFYAFLVKYIPKRCCKNGTPFHLFRLLVLYHDPELCSFLDTKKISPDLYMESWFRSMFATTCDLDVVLNIWDVYLQHADPFLLFFLALVILVNAKEQLLTMASRSKQDIIDKLVVFPNALEADDIEDFCSLAQYYSSRTPQSFRRVYHEALYGTSLTPQQDDAETMAGQALCLPVSISELMQASQMAASEVVRYFVVDCRPADQYNAGHLPTAFHLDANLMLMNPAEFASAVQALSAAQTQAIAAGSAAGGEHLCFMGSGREEEDQYVYMVVANFLQRNSLFVSVAQGGYAALHEVLRERLQGGLTDHSVKSCILCNPDAATSNGVDSYDEYHAADESESLAERFGKLSSVVKSQSAIMKEKMINYIKNETPASERHVSSSDKVGRRYRNMASVFTIGGDGDDEGEGNETGSSDEERRDIVNIDTWLGKPDVKCAYECTEVTDTGYTYASHLLLTACHLYVLRSVPGQKAVAHVQARRPLASIVKITSKKKHPELITFKYGSNDERRGLVVTAADRFIIARAGEATKAIKMQIMKVLEALET